MRIEGVEYTDAAVDAAKAELIQLRNSFLTTNAFEAHYAVLLSHVIAYLGDYSEILNDPRGFSDGDGDAWRSQL